MQRLKLFSTAALSGLILLACSGIPADKTTSASSPDPSGTSGSGKDMYYEYMSTTVGSGMTIKSNIKMYVSAGGAMRVEMEMENSAMKGKGPVKIITIGNSDKPNESISIEDDTRTYSVNHFKDSDFKTGEKIKSTAVKVGEEKILGFNSVHARVVSDKASGNFNLGTDTLDLWRSNEVPAVASVKELMDKFEAKTGTMLYSPETIGQLKQMGCVGFTTQLEIHSKRSSTRETLVKAEHRDCAASMFQIPAGYKETKDGIGE